MGLVTIYSFFAHKHISFALPAGNAGAQLAGPLMHFRDLVIGAGPAGLTTAYELSKNGRSVAIVERDPHYVGGISRTVNYKGYRFDIGGHRFFSKSAEIEALWTELLGDELLERPRSSPHPLQRQAVRLPAPRRAMR